MRIRRALILALLFSSCAAEVSDEPLEVAAATEALTYTTINSNGGASLLANGAGKLGCLRGYIMTLQSSYNCSGDTCTIVGNTNGVRAKQCWDFVSPNGTPEFSRQCAFEFFAPNGSTTSVPHLLLYTPGYNKCAVYPVNGGARWGEVRLNENRLYVPPPAATKNMKSPPPPAPPGTGGMNCPGGLMVGPGICAN